LTSVDIMLRARDAPAYRSVDRNLLRNIASSAIYEITLDGYRLEAVRESRWTTLYSRREYRLNQKFPSIATALQRLPNETVIDGKVVALGADGRPGFHLLQNFRSAESRIVYFAFDILISERRCLMRLPLSERRAILASLVEPGAWRAGSPSELTTSTSSASGLDCGASIGLTSGKSSWWVAIFPAIWESIR
jgi:ATP-dependent DNA ligase